MSLTFSITPLCLGSALLTSALSLGANAGEAELKEDFAFFQDPTCVVLKTEVGEKDLTRFKTTLLRDVARQLLEGSYDTRHRASSYQAYPSPSALQRMIKLGMGSAATKTSLASTSKLAAMLFLLETQAAGKFLF